MPDDQIYGASATDPVLASAIVGAVLGLLALVVWGFGAGGRRLADGRRARGGDVAFPALATFLRKPRTALVVLAIGVTGQALADGAVYLTSMSIGGLTSIIAFIFNAVVVYLWHRGVLREAALDAGFAIDGSNGLTALLGRLFVMGVIGGLAFLAAALLLLTPATMTANERVAMVMAGLAGPVGAAMTAWYARFSFAMPATAVRQPDAGLFEMHRRGAGLGAPLAAALWLIGGLCAALMAGAHFGGLELFALIDPQGWADYQAALALDPWSIGPPSLAAFVTLNLPFAITATFYAMWSVSAVSLAYRDWLLSQPARAGEDAPARSA